MENMREVLDNLKASSVKLRQEALASVREFFSDDRMVEMWHIKSNGQADPRLWLPVFQALFTAVLNERLALTKKMKTSSSTSVNEKRFTEATQMVRWLTERTVVYLNKKVVNALLEHFLQTVEDGGQIRSLFALDYIKALACISNYTPHLDWMEEDKWVRLIQMSFNFVLEDPMRTRFEEDEPESYNAAVKTEVGDEDMFDDDSMVTDSEPSSSRKRNRSDSDPFSPTFRRQTHQKRKPVSKEQLECMALLSTLFRSPSAPLLSNQHPYFPSSLLSRMRRFLIKYNADDTSLLHDYVLVLAYILPTLSINKIREVRAFGQACWHQLVGLWTSKNKRVKESLTIIFRLLFPFVAENEDESERADMLYALATLIDKEADSKAMGEGLSVDCLRLELPETRLEQAVQYPSAFIAKTFCAGPNFDATHAVVWSIFSLHADCIAKLYHFSESNHLKATPMTSTRRGKRARLDLENPVNSLLTNIKNRVATNARSCLLQTMLFLIDSHWKILHEELKREVAETLLQLVSVDDTKVQSWIFLCFAAIADAETHDQPALTRPHTTSSESIPSSWDSVWTNAIRRANTPTVCRTACHAAHSILLHMKTLPISQHRVLTEIESVIKDLDVQGPPVPHDSICAFLKSCLQVSSQDMRMYRLHFEDKVLTWLIDCWKPVDVTKKTISTTMPHDFTTLLATIGHFSKQCNLIQGYHLPKCATAQVLVEESRTSVVKEFMLFAKLPGLPHEVQPTSSAQTDGPSTTSSALAGLQEQKGRERRTSSFLSKALEDALAMWDDGRSPTADVARRCADLAVISLWYQGLVVLNGTQADRRVIRSACHLIQKLVTQLLAHKWTVSEKGSIISGLDPLTTTQRGGDDESSWDILASPDIGSGIKTSCLDRRTAPTNENRYQDVLRISLLRVIWQNTEVQESFVQVSASLWDILRVSMHTSTDQGDNALDDKDGFGPISTESPMGDSGLVDPSTSHVVIIDACLRFLTVGSTLQSASGEPLRKKELVDVFLSCADNSTELFLLVFPRLLQAVRQGYLHFGSSNLSDALSTLETIIVQYAFQFAKNSAVQLLVIQLLWCTLNIWGASGAAIQPRLLENIQLLCSMVVDGLQGESLRSWSVRDAIARFLSAYLAVNPFQTTWADVDMESDDRKMNPVTLLYSLNSDRDVRVRFRTSLLCTQLFALRRECPSSISNVYSGILPYLTKEPENYEHVLSRMIVLGNVMIASSETRRGPYWHLLETCLYTNNEQIPINYEGHIQAVLHAVAQRLGFQTLASFFEAYASQLAFSMCQVAAGGDPETQGQISNVIHFPYRILGYENRLQSAIATFRPFSPTNIWNNGQRQFTDHCRAIGKTREEGIISCFGDIVGYEVVRWLGTNQEPGDLSNHLQNETLSGEEFDTQLESTVDAIVVFILQTLGDQDVSEAGPYFLAFKTFGNNTTASRIFKDLTRFRDVSGFEPHQPNLPSYPVTVILSSLEWLRYQSSEVDAPSTTYHVIQQLFAQIERTSLINEQLRLINAISLWVSTHHTDFNNHTMLYALIRGSASLFQQVDLRTASQSILDWSFDQLRKVGSSQRMLSDILLRIACIGNDHLYASLEVEQQSAAREILAWIDDQVFRFSQVQSFAEEAKKALAAWPHCPNGPLEEMYQAVSPQTIASALQGLKSSSNRFRLVSRLRQFAGTPEYPVSTFTTLDFWRLKRCIPASEDLNMMDIDAFLHLLYLTRGTFESLASEEDQTSLLSRRQRLAHAMQRSGSGTKQDQEARKKRYQSSGDDDTGMCSVVLLLLDRLHGDNSHHAHASYHTLRRIGDLHGIGEWIPEHANELQFLAKAQAREPMELGDRSLNTLQADEWLSLAEEPLKWTTSIATFLSEVLSQTNPFYYQIIPTLQSDPTFASEIFPVLIHALLRTEQQGLAQQPIRQLLSEYFGSILRSQSVDVRCSRLILETVLHLRNFFPINSREALAYNSWLDLDYPLLASRAISCGMYTSAILCLELGNEVGNTGKFARETEDILYQIYEHIDEPDGFYGITYKDPHRNLLKRFEHEKQWDRAFRFHGAALEAGYTQDDHGTGLVQSFHAIGLNQLANDVLQNSSVPNNSVSETDYRLPWRTETWDLPDTTSHQGGAPLYLALRAIHRERDESAVDAQIRKGIMAEMNHLRELGVENFIEIQATIQELLCLGETYRWRSGLGSTFKSVTTFTLPELEDIDTNFDFPTSEGILATRMSLMRAARSKAERQQIGTLQSPLTRALLDAEKRCVLNLSAVARYSNQDQIALNSIIRAQRLENARSLEVSEEFANVLWCQKEERSAVEYLDRLSLKGDRTDTHDHIPANRMALILARLGSWSSKACLKQPSEIQQDYFQKATDLLSTVDVTTQGGNAFAEIYYEYAVFAEEQYHFISNSPDVLRRKIYRDRKRQEIEAAERELLSNMPDSNGYKSVKGELGKLKKQYDEDTKMHQTYFTSLNTFLNGAIEMYSLCLHASDAFDQDAATRLCSLWFGNFQIEDKSTQDTISNALRRVPSRKFIFLAHQLAARMSTTLEEGGRTTKPRCQEDLQALLLRMCREHPFHSLYQVYSLKGDLQSIVIPGSGSHSQRTKHGLPGQNERMLAAAGILDRLRSEPASSTRVKDMERLSLASIRWAKHKIDKNLSPGSQHPIPNVEVRKIQHLNVPVMTAYLPVDLTMKYDKLCTIARFRSHFKVCGGVTLPKVTTCVGSDGKEYQQLFKGDDLRQDAVMEQVFTLVNTILDRDRQTKRRNLCIRTYKIIPLEQQSGVLEFVENTSPLKTWLDRSHMKYHPKDLKPRDTYSEIAKIHAKYMESDSEKLYQAYAELEKKIRPVMRHFFTEKHKVPMSWFSMRLSYTRSVATTSIVGHVLGLGDRHTSNILIDNVSGDVVHIDLGVAFDQGKVLPVPELVPFRMTRDMVDGMGLSGTSGVFQRCAEETLRVIRDGSAVLMTVLEVFKHDPLYNWTVDKFKVERIQQDSTASEVVPIPGSTIGIDMSSGKAEEAADRALVSVSRKLDKGLSVEYTVNQLIREATDKKNLARIFKGWASLL